MIKFILCACALALCVALAWLMTRGYRRRMQFYYNLNLFNERLLNEVSYTRVPLPAFLDKYTFSGDFGNMLAEKKQAQFAGGKYDYYYLDEDERKFLDDYFKMIGKSDAASQRVYLSATQMSPRSVKLPLITTTSASGLVSRRAFFSILKCPLCSGLYSAITAVIFKIDSSDFLLFGLYGSIIYPVRR